MGALPQCVTFLVEGLVSFRRFEKFLCLGDDDVARLPQTAGGQGGVHTPGCTLSWDPSSSGGAAPVATVDDPSAIQAEKSLTHRAMCGSLSLPAL
eukprot:CAMPEP_0204360818 /NCGR_PEP_ID=MMETSP0469-20131031/38338_1 /ASSEMBLY_ACC=CAM_ASM_000384 /TAXON_ID=2969 /ORGANISM="Oxyrrhis marina" /LENGTH=94 /DNA_ID=CAMNT_0051349111 /DNA_START=45 /DNA_END=326 /DNA_ORIENTATION=+